MLQRQRPIDYARLCAAIGYTPKEAEQWREAADKMYYPAPVDGIYPQDDDFLNRKPWPLDTIPADKHPLLIRSHGESVELILSFDRKQAKTVLFLLKVSIK